MNDQSHETPDASGGFPDSGMDANAPLEQILAMIQVGGPVVVILIAMSVFALALVLLKLWQFHACGIGERQSSRQAIVLYRAGNGRDALSTLQALKSPLAQIVALAIRGRLRSDLNVQTLREEIVRHGTNLLENLRSWFRPLEVIASLAPLLGLFGTVLGMIEAFRQLEAAGNQVNPAILSGGIWAALLTTAAGLAVAIPVVAVLSWLERRVERLAHEMDDAVTRIFTEDLSEDSATDTNAWHPGGTESNAPASFRASASATGE